MRLKPLLITVAVLAVLSAVTFFIRRPAPPPSADPRLGQPLVDQATLEKAAKLRLAEAGKTVTLVRQSDGGWSVAEYFDFPADFSKLSSFVANLTDAKLERLVGSNPERIARLEFKDTKIELLDPANKPLWSVTLGKSSETGNGRFVRFGDEPKAFLATLSAWLDTTPKNWADTSLLKLKPEDIAKIEFTFADAAPVTFTRTKKEDPWTSEQTPDHQRPKSEKIAAALGALTTLRFSETVDPQDASVAEAKPHQRTVNLTTFDGKTIAIALARKPEERQPKPAIPAPEKSPENVNAAPAEASSEPQFETIPAGPVFVTIEHSDTSAPTNSFMQKRAFQIYEYAFTSLPQKREDLFEPAPAATPTTTETK